MASPVDPVILAMERNWEMIDAALDGLDDAAMGRQPRQPTHPEVGEGGGGPGGRAPCRPANC